MIGIISWLAYAAATVIMLSVAGGVLVFIASISAILGGIMLSLFVAGFIAYAIRDYFRR